SDDRDCNSTAAEFFTRFGVQRSWLRTQGIVGEMGWQFFDANGAALQGEEYCVGLTISDYRSIARDRDRDVVLVGGHKKTPAIRAALKGNLVSILITDQQTAEDLIHEPAKEF